MAILDLHHYPYDQGKSGGAGIRSAALSPWDDFKNIRDQVSTLTAMIQGDEDQAASYANMVVQIGFKAAGTFTANEIAMAAYKELQACFGQMQGIAATLEQCANRFR